VPRQDRHNRRTRRGQLGQDILDRTARTRQLGQNSQDRSARTGQPGHDLQNAKGRTGKADTTVGTKSSQVRIARVGLFGVECQDMTARQDSLEKTARLG
jgi:hypothetical protein